MLPDIHRATQKFYIFLIVYLTGCTPFLFLEASPLLHKSKFFLYFLQNRVRIKSYMFKYMMMLNLEVNK